MTVRSGHTNRTISPLWRPDGGPNHSFPMGVACCAFPVHHDVQVYPQAQFRLLDEMRENSERLSRLCRPPQELFLSGPWLCVARTQEFEMPQILETLQRNLGPWTGMVPPQGLPRLASLSGDRGSATKSPGLARGRLELTTCSTPLWVGVAPATLLGVAIHRPVSPFWGSPALLSVRLGAAGAAGLPCRPFWTGNCIQRAIHSHIGNCVLATIKHIPHNARPHIMLAA